MGVHAFSQNVYENIDQITEFESFFQRLKIEEDSTAFYVEHSKEYESYTEYEGKFLKDSAGLKVCSLRLTKRWITPTGRSPFGIGWHIQSDTALELATLKYWDYRNEFQEVTVHLDKHHQFDTILPIDVKRGAMFYSPMWNPTNKDELVQKVRNRRDAEWHFYSNTPMRKWGFDVDYELQVSLSPKK